MSFLRRMLGASKQNSSDPRSDQSRLVDLGDRRGELPLNGFALKSGGGVTIVGESFHQDAIERLIGGRQREPTQATFWATLVPEPDNPRDKDAISIRIDGQHVGYIAREECKAWAPVLARLSEGQQVAYCKANIVGGGPRHDGGHASYGVFAYAAGPSDQLERIAMEIDGKTRAEVAAARPALTDGRQHGPGTYRGHHHSEWHAEARRLRTIGDDDEALAILLGIVDATEAEAKHEGYGVAPAAYEQLAVIYRKRKDSTEELSILERYASQSRAPGQAGGKLLERLDRVRRASR